MTLDKKKKVLMNIYDAQINRQLKNIRKGGYTESKALKDVSKMQQVMKKYNK